MIETPLLWTLLVSLVSFVAILRRWLNPLHSIKTVGPSAPLLSYIGAYRFLSDAQEMLREGYTKFKGSTFKIAMMDQWIVVVNGPAMVEELRSYPDEKVSFMHAVAELIQPKYTLGVEVYKDPYHITLVRERLTRNLGNLLPEVIDELDIAMKEYIPTQGNEWVSVPGLSVMQHVVARITNRIFVGAPKCRDLDYLDLAINFTTNVIQSRAILSLFPAFMKPIIGFFLRSAQQSSKRAMRHLQPIFEEREKKVQEFGEDWLEKPNDMLMWLMDEARGKPQMLEAVVKRILMLNFAAIHSSASSVTHALYHLAENPEIAPLLRGEMETVIAEHGWSKNAFGKMWKLDSFMKESQRFNGLNGMAVVRVVLDNMTLSDGTRIPSGTIVAAGATTLHRDEDLYENPETFDPLRFHKMWEEGTGIKHGFASTRADYIAFGRGRHACPGRFYAEHELKAILTYVVLNFDIKFDNEPTRPKNKWIASTIVPAQHAKILFRRRR